MGRYTGLTPAVLAAKLDGGRIFRVVVGPVDQGQEKAIHRRIAKAGISDTWAILVSPGEWPVATHGPVPSPPTAEVAGLPR